MDKIDKMDKIVNPKSSIVNRKSKIVNLLIAAMIGFNSCGDWLDVVPDNVATLDMAFNSRTQARHYLGTCYSFMPKDALSTNPALLGSDELYAEYNQSFRLLGFSEVALDLARGMLNSTTSILGRWNSMYEALRVCNTFLENVSTVPDLPPLERVQWIAEAKVLKAYYHFLLVQMYGPIPLIRENTPVSANVSAVKIAREPVDVCFDYIVKLLDEACDSEVLPNIIFDEARDLGRITQPIAKSLKAKVLVMAASPLFNGNNDQTTLLNNDNTPLFNATEDPAKWQRAVTACREAIQVCHDADIMLYKYLDMNNRYTDTIVTDLTLRNAFNLQWNSEIIWANTQSMVSQGQGNFSFASAPNLVPGRSQLTKFISVPSKIATLFYTNHGVPLDEDRTMVNRKIYDLRTAQPDEQRYIRAGRISLDLHFDREPRFYAWLGFDGAVWFGADRQNDQNPSTLRWLGMKMDEPDGTSGIGNWTGYFAKKFVPLNAQWTVTNTLSCTSYPWPIMRLSDLYLLLAEAINEAEGPDGPNSAEMFDYINRVRARAGLKGVKESWDAYAISPKYKTPDGMQQIIRQERMIELSFEGQRFWDIRRWKTAPDLYRTPVEGWFMNVSNIDGTESETSRIFYTPQFLLQQTFGIRDYFWPIKSSDIDVNPNLVQNIGW